MKDESNEKPVKSLISQIGKSIDMMGGYRNLSDGSDQPVMLINGKQVYQIRDDS